MPHDRFREEIAEVMALYGLRAHTQTQFHSFAAMVGYGMAIRVTQRRVWWVFCEQVDPMEADANDDDA